MIGSSTMPLSTRGAVGCNVLRRPRPCQYVPVRVGHFKRRAGAASSGATPAGVSVTPRGRSIPASRRRVGSSGSGSSWRLVYRHPRIARTHGEADLQRGLDRSSDRGDRDNDIPVWPLEAPAALWRNAAEEAYSFRWDHSFGAKVTIRSARSGNEVLVT
jgi:hypothetical protein